MMYVWCIIVIIIKKNNLNSVGKTLKQAEDLHIKSVYLPSST